MEAYDAYKGSLDELSKPDQFMYQLSRVPGYDQRLKAMLFKANFAEKVDEVKQVSYGLLQVRIASGFICGRCQVRVLYSNMYRNRLIGR